MRELDFTKMHGAGNDFIIIDNRNQILTIEELIDLAPRLCHRKFGVGADGIMALQSPDRDGVDYTMIYRNADGSDAGMCGNGARCLALYAANLGLGTQLKFNVHDTVYQAQINNDNSVKIAFPMTVRVSEKTVDNATFYQMHAGTEHIVQQVEAETFSDDELLTKRGRQLRHHEKFNPPGTNVNFIRPADKEGIKIKTYERGVEGLTLACGTGAVAGAIGWHYINESGQAANTIQVNAEGGDLSVTFNFNVSTRSYHNITLSGPAQIVFNGTYIHDT